MKFYLVAWLAVVTPMASAATLTCSDLKYGSDQYRSNMQELARQANLPGGTYSKYHERVVNNFCEGDAVDTKKLVGLGYVTAEEVASIQNALKPRRSNANTGKVAAAPTTTKTSTPSDLPVINKAVDGAFIQWSRLWAWDKYIPGSTQIEEGTVENGVNVIRGTFKFSRGQSIGTIPFASALQKQGADWIVSSLCYNDTTSGMTDCANSGTSAATREFMSAVIVGGLLSAMSNGGLSDSNNNSNSATGSNEERMRQEERDANAAVRENERVQQNLDWQNKMSQPNPYLDPQ